MWNPEFTVNNTIQTVVQVILFLVGLFINIKIVLISWKDKEPKTWQIQIVYSVSIILYSAFYIPFPAISQSTEHLAAYTGVWFCHVAVVVNKLFLYIVASNSLIVAVVKYIFIVHPLRALQWGHEKIQKICLVIYLALPFIHVMFDSAIRIFTKNYSSVLSLTIKRCFGLKGINSGKPLEKQFLYNLKASSKDGPGITTVENMIHGFGVFQQILAIVLLSNITEIFLYYLIFKKMKRFVIFINLYNFRGKNAATYMINIIDIYIIFINLDKYLLHLTTLLQEVWRKIYNFEIKEKLRLALGFHLPFM